MNGSLLAQLFTFDGEMRNGIPLRTNPPALAVGREKEPRGRIAIIRQHDQEVPEVLHYARVVTLPSGQVMFFVEHGLYDRAYAVIRAHFPADRDGLWIWTGAYQRVRACPNQGKPNALDFCPFCQQPYPSQAATTSAEQQRLRISSENVHPTGLCSTVWDPPPEGALMLLHGIEERSAGAAVNEVQLLALAPRTQLVVHLLDRFGVVKQSTLFSYRQREPIATAYSIAAVSA